MSATVYFLNFSRILFRLNVTTAIIWSYIRTSLFVGTNVATVPGGLQNMTLLKVNSSVISFFPIFIVYHNCTIMSQFLAQILIIEWKFCMRSASSRRHCLKQAQDLSWIWELQSFRTCTYSKHSKIVPLTNSKVKLFQRNFCDKLALKNCRLFSTYSFFHAFYQNQQYCLLHYWSD